MIRLPAGRPSSHGSIPGRGMSFFFFRNIHTLFVYLPASYSVGTTGVFPGVKRSEREHDYSLQCLGQE